MSSGAAFVSQAAACVSQAPARVSPLDARRASISLSRPRVAVPEIETAEQYVLSVLRGPKDRLDLRGGLGAHGLLDALDPGSSAPRSGEHFPPPQENAAAASRSRREVVGNLVFRA